MTNFFTYLTKGPRFLRVHSRVGMEASVQRPWGKQTMETLERIEESWTAKLHYDIFVFWRDVTDMFVGPESDEVCAQKWSYSGIVDKVHKTFLMLCMCCLTYTRDAKIQIVGLTRMKMTFDEKLTVNANFQWIREVLAKCEDHAEAQLRQLDDAYSTTRTWFATDRKAAEALADDYLTTEAVRDVVVPASDDDKEREDVSNELLMHLVFRRFRTLVRDDVDRLADLRDETFAKNYDYWELPPWELIELLLRAKETVLDVSSNISELRARLGLLHSIYMDIPGRRPLSLDAKAQHLRSALAYKKQLERISR